MRKKQLQTELEILKYQNTKLKDQLNVYSHRGFIRKLKPEDGEIVENPDIDGDTLAMIYEEEITEIRNILYPLYEGQHKPFARMRDIAQLAADELRAARKKTAFDSASEDVLE